MTHVLLTRPPLYSQSCPRFLVRLACVRRAASVDSEPGSNSRWKTLELSSPGWTQKIIRIDFAFNQSVKELDSCNRSFERVAHCRPRKAFWHTIVRARFPGPALCLPRTWKFVSASALHFNHTSLPLSQLLSFPVAAHFPDYQTLLCCASFFSRLPLSPVRLVSVASTFTD